MNKVLNKVVILIVIILFNSACSRTIVLEKQSEQVSKTVYATKDSLDKARVDLASQYINEATKLIVPPKKRILIESLQMPQTESNKINRRMVVVPKEYGGDEVLVVGSKEYNELLNVKQIAEQLSSDNSRLQEEKNKTDQQIQLKEQNIKKMSADIINLQLDVAKKQATIYKLILCITGLIGATACYVYLKIKSLLPSFLIF